MAQIPYVNSTGEVTAIVQLKNAADVFLVDENNYRKFKAHKSFDYYGGHYTKTPVRITVSGTGRWYLIVIGSSYKYKFV